MGIGTDFGEGIVWDTDEADSLCEETDKPDRYGDGFWCCFGWVMWMFEGLFLVCFLPSFS